MRRAALALLLVLPLLFAGCTSENDNDGLDAAAERSGWLVRVTTVDGSVTEYAVTADPTVEDTDGDGLNDFAEFRESSDPRNIDTDGDGLIDGPVACPDEGSALARAIADAGILAHPERPGCFFGEARWERDGKRIQTSPTDAHTDSGVGIGDGLSDGEELVGWDVTVGGRTYHVWSNPMTPDSDNEGLHDGLEKLLGLDPHNPDTDGDTVNDVLDAAPLGNLRLAVTIESLNLKQDKRLTGGANLVVVAETLDESARSQARTISKGSNTLGLTLALDPADMATGFSQEGYGAGHWTSQVQLSFWHNGPDGEPIRVRSGDQGHRLDLDFDAAAGTWRGHGSGGSSSGPDADVRFDVEAFFE